MSEEYKVIVTNTDEEIKEEELKRLIDEALSKTETIEEILKAKEEELKETKLIYKELKNDFRKTREILKELIMRIRFSSIVLRIEQSGSVLFGSCVDPSEFDAIIDDMKLCIKELKADLKFLKVLEKAFKSLTKYNIYEKMYDITDLLTLYYQKSNLREKILVKKINILSAKVKGFNMQSHSSEEKDIEEKDNEIMRLTMELGL